MSKGKGEKNALAPSGGYEGREGLFPRDECFNDKAKWDGSNGACNPIFVEIQSPSHKCHRDEEANKSDNHSNDDFSMIFLPTITNYFYLLLLDGMAMVLLILEAIHKERNQIGINLLVFLHLISRRQDIILERNMAFDDLSVALWSGYVLSRLMYGTLGHKFNLLFNSIYFLDSAVECLAHINRNAMKVAHHILAISERTLIFVIFNARSPLSNLLVLITKSTHSRCDTTHSELEKYEELANGTKHIVSV